MRVHKMNTQILQNIYGISKEASKLTHAMCKQTVCGSCMHNIVLPRSKRAIEAIAIKDEPAKLSIKSKIVKEQPLRKKICRFIFKEFFHACGIRVTNFNLLNNLTNMQVALLSGLIAGTIGVAIG